MSVGGPRVYLRNREYLEPYGGYDASDEALDAVFERWLPEHRMRHIYAAPGLPLYFAGNVYHLTGLRARPARLLQLAVRSGWRSAGAVVLIVEELLSRGEEPPAELLACAALCWAEDLVRRPEER